MLYPCLIISEHKNPAVKVVFVLKTTLSSLIQEASRRCRDMPHICLNIYKNIQNISMYIIFIYIYTYYIYFLHICNTYYFIYEYVIFIYTHFFW